MKKLSLTPEEATLVCTLFQQIIHKLEASMKGYPEDTLNMKRAQYHVYCLSKFVEDHTTGKQGIVLQPLVFNVVMHHLSNAIMKRAEAMQELAEDFDMPQDNYLQVVKHAVSLLPIMHKIADLAAQRTNPSK